MEFIYEILTFLSLMASLPLLGFIGSGAGTSGDPFIVTSMAELDDVRNDLGAPGDLTWYELDNPLDGSGFGNFSPIGGNCFINFNGNGHTISNATFVSVGSTQTAGLFYELTEGIIENLYFENTTVNSNWGIVGGAIARVQSGATVRNCGMDGGTINAVDEFYVGGFVGRVAGAVENCYSKGVTVNGGRFTGGFYGLRVSSGTIDKCWSANTITFTADTTDSSAFGHSSSGNITNCFWDSDVESQVSGDPAGTGKTTAEMRDIETFTNVATVGLSVAYDMVAVGSYVDELWAIDDGVAYPILGFEVEALTTPQITVTLNESPLQNAFVKFFEMDAFTADGATTSTVFQNCAFLTGVFQTDANGVATLDIAPTAGKVVGAMVLQPDYDAEWQFVQVLRIGSNNIDLTAPA